MSKNRFLHCELLKVNATNELLVQGKPYILHLYKDEVTGINYVKLYRYQLGSVNDDIVIQHIDATHPVRSYQYDELSRIDFDKDPDGFVTITETPVTNDTVLDESEDLAIGTVTFLDLPISER